MVMSPIGGPLFGGPRGMACKVRSLQSHCGSQLESDGLRMSPTYCFASIPTILKVTVRDSASLSCKGRLPSDEAPVASSWRHLFHLYGWRHGVPPPCQRRAVPFLSVTQRTLFGVPREFAPRFGVEKSPCLDINVVLLSTATSLDERTLLLRHASGDRLTLTCKLIILNLIRTAPHRQTQYRDLSV